MFFRTHEVNLACILFFLTLTQGQCFIDSAKLLKKTFPCSIVVVNGSQIQSIFFFICFVSLFNRISSFTCLYFMHKKKIYINILADHFIVSFII